MRLVPTMVLVYEAKCQVRIATSHVWCDPPGWRLPHRENMWIFYFYTQRQLWETDAYRPGSSMRRPHDLALLSWAVCSLQGRGKLKFPVILQGFSLHQDWWLSHAGGGGDSSLSQDSCILWQQWQKQGFSFKCILQKVLLLLPACRVWSKDDVWISENPAE